MSRALIVGYDGSACAEAALEAALHFAGATDRPVLVVPVAAG